MSATCSWKLSIKTVDGKVIEIAVDDPKSITVKGLKGKIADKTQILPSEQDLSDDQLVLLKDEDDQHRDKQLKDYHHIRDGSTLRLVMTDRWFLFVRDTAKTHRLILENPQGISIAKIFAKIEEATSLQEHEYFLYHVGKPIVATSRNNSAKMYLRDYPEIHNESTLHLSMRTKGG